MKSPTNSPFCRFWGCLPLCLILVFLMMDQIAQAQISQLMPVPRDFSYTRGLVRIPVDKSFRVQIMGPENTRIEKGVERFLWRLDNRTGVLIPKTLLRKDEKGTEDGLLRIIIERKGELRPHEDESYNLLINGRGIELRAKTDLGALHGLETLLQLLEADESGYAWFGCGIMDEPRFTWRGLLIDVCRHWMPVEVIKRNLDAMALVKMNVLHLHLTEDQGFRIESKKFPKLHEMGSNGDYFSQEQIKDIIAYADARGIRVMPEFDIPGHATSWFVGHPEFASAPGPYEIEKGFGVFDPAFDPTKEETYEFFDAFLSEMAALFPDEYMHIGGDENNGQQWDKNPAIQSFMKKKGIKDNHALQSYFNERILAILEKNGKKMAGWDEILQPGISKNILIQSWRGKEALLKAAKEGYDVMLSNGWYIDLCQSAEYHYLNDPYLSSESDKQSNPVLLDADESSHILGGEATMWAELVSPETVDSRIWPRTAAIAERLWSPAQVRDVPDMYRRLDLLSLRLEEVGLTHIKNREVMLRRFCNGGDIEPLRTLIEVVGPLQVYARHGQGIKYSTNLPLTRLPDIAWPDPPVARKFEASVNEFLIQLANRPSPRNGEIQKSDDFRLVYNRVRLPLILWKDNHKKLQPLMTNAPLLSEISSISQNLALLGEIGVEAITLLTSRNPDPAAADTEDKDGRPSITQSPKFQGQLVDETWLKHAKEVLVAARKPCQEAELVVVDAVEKLVLAAEKLK